MSPRKSLRGTNIEADVLWESKRRCAVCFSLYGILDVKKGQIAHINKDRNDNRIENLVFLCFDHHDQYDSVTSQSKNFTKIEMKRYRDELLIACRQGLVTSRFEAGGNLPAIRTGLFARRSSLDGGSVISITKTRKNWDGRSVFQVIGEAYTGISRIGGPNMGFIGFETTENSSSLIEFYDGNYSLLIGATGKGILVEEEGEFGYHGVGVHFFGEYERVTSPFLRMRWWSRSLFVSHFRRGKWPDQ
ncbi:HNH endonuclease [Halovulum dunhuangense]|uniref:HNH endonuclease n=1 Tax=Halovulum dunhuangense TaxID=1505036 RepID=A0A849L3E2_9RHOB|nr:HNH endonuclease signature motif containing protein [Halovulum dunhuangense]NNU80908.1 HNH endonuclease [Halovulum dunhuangense]